MQRVQETAPAAMRDRPAPQPERLELLTENHAVLAIGHERDEVICMQ